MKPAAPATRTPPISTDELRAQLAKLEGSNATLRAKHREAGRTTKAALARIAELETEVARLETVIAASKPAPSASEAKPERANRKGRQRRQRDLGDAVPPGVAVEEPALLDAEAKAARSKLEKLHDK